MGQPGMRITVDAAMRARDVSRPRAEGEAAPEPDRGPGPGNGAATGPDATGRQQPEPARRTKAAKNERRRLGKRGGARKPSPPPNGI
ncbi:hypothetical protein OHR68_07615 [Spirillospora sp. NBC_00431]